MKLLVAALVGLLAAGAAKAQTNGVGDAEIVIGTHQPLTGPFALIGVPVRNGMQMAVDEINAAGGIHGRTLRLVVEDSAYDPKQAVLATQKLLREDKVFALVGQMGTPTVMAAMPLVLKAGVPHLFPLTAATQMYEPFDRLKFALFTPYIVQARVGTLAFIKDEGRRQVCALHQDDEFGLNVMRGAERAAAESGLALAAVAPFKRGTIDLADQVARLRNEGCDLVVLGTIIRETIAAMAEAVRIGWPVDMMGVSAAYAPEVPALGKAAVEGLFATGQIPIPHHAAATPAVQAWMDAYKSAFEKDANAHAAAGFDAVMLAAAGLRNAGRDLTVDRFVEGLEQIGNWQDRFGAPPASFGPERRLATEAVILARVKDGHWTVVKSALMY